MTFKINSRSIADDVIQIQSRSLSDPPLSEIYFKNKIAWVWTNLNILGWALGRLPDGTEGVYPSEYVTMVWWIVMVFIIAFINWILDTNYDLFVVLLTTVWPYSALLILFPSPNKHTNKLEISTIYSRMSHTLIHYELREKLVLDRFKSISALTKDYHNSKNNIAKK